MEEQVKQIRKQIADHMAEIAALKSLMKHLIDDEDDIRLNISIEKLKNVITAKENLCKTIEIEFLT